MSAGHAGWLVAVPLVFALSVSQSGRASAQQEPATPASGPLPAVVYPLRDPVVEPAGHGTPGVTAAPSPVVIEGPTYVIVGGVLGYWDSQQHFHPRSPIPPAAARSPAVAAGIGGGTTRPAQTPGQSVRRYASGLPNSPAKAIVVRPSAPRSDERGR